MRRLSVAVVFSIVALTSARADITRAEEIWLASLDFAQCRDLFEQYRATEVDGGLLDRAGRKEAGEASLWGFAKKKAERRFKARPTLPEGADCDAARGRLVEADVIRNWWNSGR
jgi:hypothetical protein